MEFPNAATDKELKEEIIDIQKEYDVVEKVGVASKEGKPIESIVEKYSEISKDDAKTIQDEKNVSMEVPTAASERGLNVVIDSKNDYGVSELMREAPSKPTLNFSILVGENNPKLLISYLNQSLMTASDGMKELDGSSFGTKIPEELQ